MSHGIRVGILGIGFMGATHFAAWRSVQGAKVTALSTRSSKKLAGDWSGIKGNFGAEGGLVDLAGVRTYKEAGDLFGDGEVDLVDICLPTHLHRWAAEAAFSAGKDVLIEKPIAGSLEEADAMIAAAARTGRKLFVGHVLRFFSQYQALANVHRSGKYGVLKALHMKRVISKPMERAGIEHRGGAVLDVHVHDINFMQMLLGMPSQVYARGHFYDEFPVHATAVYAYEGTEVSAVTGYLAVPSIKFEQGYTAYFEEATVQYSSLMGAEPLVWLRGTSEPHTLEQSTTDPFVAELQYVADACSGRSDGSLLSAHEARGSLQLVEAVTESMRTGRPVAVD